MALVGVRWGGGAGGESCGRGEGLLWKRRGIAGRGGEMRTGSYAVAYQRGGKRAMGESYNVL
jgi:hypothetical protein